MQILTLMCGENLSRSQITFHLLGPAGKSFIVPGSSLGFGLLLGPFSIVQADHTCCPGMDVTTPAPNPHGFCLDLTLPLETAGCRRHSGILTNHCL